MHRPLLLFLFAAAQAALVACGGSGATVSADSDLSEARDAGKVAPSDPATPVMPGTRLECKTTRPFYDGAVHTLRFVVNDGDLVEPFGGDPPIEVTPETSQLAHLNDEPVSEHTGGKLVVRGGAKTELALFDNSDLTKGYVKADGKYAEIFCTRVR